MQERKTPEEKLLKIIENPLNIRRPASAAGFKGRAKAKGLASIKAWFVQIKSDKKELRSFFAIHNINKGMAGLCVLLTFFGLFNFISESSAFRVRMESLIKNPAILEAGLKEKYPVAWGLSEMQNELKRRNIFSFLPPQSEVPLMPAAVAQTISNLKLVGILWSDNPQVMIENAQEQKTYLLSAGEQIGQIKIKKILRDSVIIGKDEQEWVLR